MLPRNAGDPAELGRLRQQLVIAMAALGVVTTVGVIGYTVIGGDDYDLIDAVYMTVITLTTVGFGEVIDLSNNPAGRFFTIVLLLGGLGVVLYAVPLLGAFIIEGELFNAFARRKMEKAIARMTDHYIVCGDTSAADYVADELIKTRRKVVFVAPSDAAVAHAREIAGDFPYIVGDPTDDATLLQGAIERTAGVVTSMESDKDNILVVRTSGYPKLDELAIKSLKKWTFIPLPPDRYRDEVGSITFQFSIR